MLKVTASVNPFSPLTETVKAGLTPPIVAATCAGEMDRLKSFAAVTVKFNLAACASPPLFPCTVIVATPAVADAGILSVTFWPAPAAIVKGAAGELVVPEGNPANDTLTAPENPFMPVTVIPTGVLVPPACCVMSAGEALIVKSGAGGVPPPPHPEVIATAKTIGKIPRCHTFLLTLVSSFSLMALPPTPTSE